ncbi:Transcriptional regulator [Dimargaris cristalligena]|nr:Transcriptional regulator [Dimargaris cristalligena]
MSDTQDTLGRTGPDAYFHPSRSHLYHRYMRSGRASGSGSNNSNSSSNSSSSGGNGGRSSGAHNSIRHSSDIPEPAALQPLHLELEQFAAQASLRAEQLKKELRSLRSHFVPSEPVETVLLQGSGGGGPLTRASPAQPPLSSASSSAMLGGSNNNNGGGSGPPGSPYQRPRKISVSAMHAGVSRPDKHRDQLMSAHQSPLQKSHSFSGSRKRSDSNDSLTSRKLHQTPPFRPTGVTTEDLSSRTELSGQVSYANASPRHSTDRTDTVSKSQRMSQPQAQSQLQSPPSPTMSHSSMASNDSYSTQPRASKGVGARTGGSHNSKRKRKHGTIDEEDPFGEYDDNFKATNSPSRPTQAKARSEKPVENLGHASTPLSGGHHNSIGDVSSPLRKHRPAEGSSPPWNNDQPKVHKTSAPPRVVDEDFSRVKVTSEVPITTFWTSVEPYFRPLTDNDLLFLQEEADNVTPYLTPHLGRHYTQVWAEEDQKLFPNGPPYSTASGTDPTTSLNNPHPMTKIKSRPSSRGSKLGSAIPAPLDSLPPPLLPPPTIVDRPPVPPEGKPIHDFLNEHLVDDEVGCGPLTDRIVNALIQDKIIEPPEDYPDDDGADPDLGSVKSESGLGLFSGGAVEIAGLEERLARELRYIGLLGDTDVDWAAREDDEVSAVLRHAQRQLREQAEINHQRKARLLDVVRDHLAYQEYRQIVDELDKQVEQSYLKRNRHVKTKRKKILPTRSALSDLATSGLERRRRIMDSIGCIFPDEKYLPPTTSIYEGIAGGGGGPPTFSVPSAADSLTSPSRSTGTAPP